MKRAMTIIAITEDDHPCWAEVDTIWKKYGLENELQLNTEQAKDYVKSYANKELGMTSKAMEGSETLLQDIFNYIDENKDGQVSRDEMFSHLKRTREIEFERKESNDNSPKLVSNVGQMSELTDEKDRLIKELNTPLSIPGSPSPKAGKSSKPLKLLPMQEIADKEEPEPDDEPED